MDKNWKRPKTLPSKTISYEISCGTLHGTYCYLDEEMTKLCEMHFNIGKGGTPCNLHLNTMAKSWSMLLQSEIARERIVKKFRKQFAADGMKEVLNCGNPFTHEGKTYKSCVELLALEVIKDLSR